MDSVWTSRQWQRKNCT
ncbi:unnamed protein product [Victoria cruziana]